ncbi:hypothetical protein AD947_07470 [Acetobacter tropicalis]|uniref:Uncharacterized protein n=1 Tax=Acetobacter tropicalis TaxID=104102 RepID=A0A149TY43_9PROT|nr:hypothetical protein [Acetobacter tropicalis]KXV58016.1 hypothetical protein AD947_07470 [Acetobacter tropicalis]
MEKETEYGTLEVGGEYVTNPFSPLDTADTAAGNLHPASPFLAISLLRTALLWSRLHPWATVGQRIALAQEVAKELGVDVGCIG